ncbi:MAG: hypothetical protein M1830_008107 [Pleopsidium flavum]|nr:MAG: hypothetical protein M1830_008107 [Pleopsidium flavum]
MSAEEDQIRVQSMPESTVESSLTSPPSSIGFGSNPQPNQQTLLGGAKPFGQTTTSGGGLFGNNTATATSSTGFGGFGTNSNTTNTSSPFGGGNTGGGLFGSSTSKPAFGTGGSSGGLFGAAGFGTTNSQPTGAFGSPASTALSSVNPQTDGTGNTPFQATTERESGSTQTNHFQSISFMQPFQKFSFEELRLADYAQGRRYGNGSGQAGAFGTSTGFGGFGQTTGGSFGATGTTGGGLFGATTNSNSSPFGGAQPANTGFGGNSGTSAEGLFGAKPAGGGLFGQTAATSSQPSGGLFGTSGSTGFGASGGTGFGGGATGGGLFGNTGANQANNNTGFKLGAATTGTFGQSTTGGFGQPNTTGGGGLFGSSTATSSPFGGGQGQQSGTSNLFGGFGQGSQTQNQGSTSSPFGGFGNNQAQQKPGGLFGNSTTTNTGSNLFGTNANNQQQPSSGLFGNTGSTQQGGGGLFGNYPAAPGTSGGLFEDIGTNSTSNTGGSLFSGLGNNQQNQQNQSGGLFGNNQQPDKPGGLFGQTTNNTNNTGGGLFSNLGSNTNNQPSGGSSLFGNLGNNNQNQQQQSGSLFGNSTSSVLGNSQQNQQQQGLLASLTDQNPYGSQSIFSGLPPPSQQNTGPIATPLSTAQKMKKSAILPQYRSNPNAAPRLVTPQKRGFGFSYSTYGTPSSISSNASTPGGLSSSLLGGSLGRSLGKSFSTSNLRRRFDAESDSILSPGAFSANSTRYSNTGSLKRLTIDRNIRTDLFGSQPIPALPSPDKNDQSKQPGILKKKVSFDSSTVGGNGNGSGRLFDNDKTNGALTRTEDGSATPSAEEQGFLRSSSLVNGDAVRPNGAVARPEMEQIKGNELAIVHEDGSPEPSTASGSQSSNVDSTSIDPQPGDYYMKPSRKELQAMSRDQLKQVSGFIIGRQGCGHVRFDQPVNLTTVELDDIFDNIAVIQTRSLTVYADTSSKPPEGKGLNVPSTITLENSWPRSADNKLRSYETSGSKFKKHVRKLQRVGGTHFVKYDKDTGEWVFTVPHFTTYQLDYGDDETDGENLDESVLSAPPDTPTPKSRTPKGLYSQTSSLYHSPSILTEESSRMSSAPDDTFDFKNKKILPGAYDDDEVYEEDLAMSDEDDIEDNGSSLDERSVDSPLENTIEEPSKAPNHSVRAQDKSAMTADRQMQEAGIYPSLKNHTTELRGGGDSLRRDSPSRPKSILKVSQQQSPIGFATPLRVRLNVGNDWAEQLQRTVSPRKQDRQALRERQGTVLKEGDEDHKATPTRKPTTNGGASGFATSIDLMNSLFGQNVAKKSRQGTKEGSKGKSFEV